MSVKYFVYAGGRWCELDAGSGRVAGWRRRARFLFVEGGRLQAARSAAVLRGLRALAAGQPSSVRDGPPLSQRRRYRRPARKKQPSVCTHHHCCKEVHAQRCSNIIEASPQKIIELASPRKADACVQVTVDASTDTRDHFSTTVTLHQPTQVIPRAKRKRSISNSATTKKTRVDSSEEQVTPSTVVKHTHPSKEHCKELVINEDDADLYRAYLINHDPSFDLYRFDTEEEYKLNTFFRINPLVNVERCARIERMLRASRSQDEMSLKDFAIKLGLRSVSDQESEETRRYKMRRRCRKEEKTKSTSSEETEKENETVQGKKVEAVKEVSRVKENTELESRNLRKKLMVDAVRRNISKEHELRVETREKKSYAEVELSSSPENSESDFVKKKPRFLAKKMPPVKKFPIRLTAQSQQSNQSQGSKRSGVGGGREYSNLEDHAIVSWVSSGARARMVNGNRVWRELQDQYQRLSGTQRTWHSLRNRYLRYILPSLGALALAPQHAQRLRAAAAAGELKNKKREWRQNSLLVQPRTAKGAWARRPPPPTPPRPASPSPPRQSPPRARRGSSAESDSPPTPGSPTRRVLRSSGAHASPVAHRSSPRARVSYTPDTYEEVTRRFALRHRSTPRSADHSPKKSQEGESLGSVRVTRKRGLYNPNAPMSR